MTKSTALGTLLGRLRRDLGTQRDPANSLKIKISLKKCDPNVDSLPIFVHKAAFNDFCVILHQIFTKNCWTFDGKFDVFLHIIACFFEYGAPHETSYFTMRKLLFHFLNLCIFSKRLSKSWVNTSKTNFCFKKPSTMAPGGPFWLPKRSQIHGGETWNPKNALKKWFSDHAISWILFKTSKILNNLPREAQG